MLNIFLDTMYKSFPRQVGIPGRKTFQDVDSMLNFINKNNGLNRVFVSVYNYTGDELIDQTQLQVDKLFFDLDSKHCYENTVKLHDWLTKQNYKHLILFSGKGFHVYVFTKGYEKLKNKKDALYNIQHHIANEVELSIGNSETHDLDEHIIGDLARIATMLGTWNGKRKKYCICINEQILESGYENISKLAERQDTHFKFFGTDYIDISKFDSERPQHISSYLENPEVKLQINNDEFLKSLPDCIANWLTLPHVGFKRRGYIICYLRDKGYLMHEVVQILKRYLSEGEFIHCTTKRVAPGYSEPGEEQVQYFYKPYVMDHTSFPGCEKLKILGECPNEGTCGKNNIYA